MEDKIIVELFLQRDETAVSEAKNKYWSYCYAIAYNILNNREDSEEAASDTFVAAWEAIPPDKPDCLSPFLGRIARNIALNKLRTSKAIKRGGGKTDIAISELEGCLPSSFNTEIIIEEKELAKTINAFLSKLAFTERNVFVCRYWYLDSIKSIASRYGFTQSKVKMMLKRTREKLKIHLEKEEIDI